MKIESFFKHFSYGLGITDGLAFQRICSFEEPYFLKPKSL